MASVQSQDKVLAGLETEYGMTANEAVRFKVERHRGNRIILQSLREIGIKKATKLDRMLEREEPGTRLFAALVISCHIYDSKMKRYLGPTRRVTPSEAIVPHARQPRTYLAEEDLRRIDHLLVGSTS